MSALSRTTYGVALAGVLLASTACSKLDHSAVAVGTPLPAHQVLRMDGMDVTLDGVSPVGMNTDGTQKVMATYTVSVPDKNTEPWTWHEGDQVVFTDDGKQYPADKDATVTVSKSGLSDVIEGGSSEQSQVVFDIPAGAKVTTAGVYVNDALYRINV